MDDAKVDRINRGFATVITEADPTFFELAESVAKLTVGIFLKTNFEGARMVAFESFVAQVRERLGEDIEAGKALEDEHHA